MRRPSSSSMLLAIGMAVGDIASPALAKKTLTDVPLVWAPKTKIAELGVVDLTGVAGVRLEVGGFTDGRAQRGSIGENRKGKLPRPVATKDEVGAWVAGRLRDLLPQLGFEVVASGGDVVLSGEVLRFFVVETKRYEGDVGLRLALKTVDGAALWSGMANGSSSRTGVPYRAINFQEALSESLLQAIDALVENEQFRKAMGSAPRAAR